MFIICVICEVVLVTYLLEHHLCLCHQDLSEYLDRVGFVMSCDP